MRKGLAAGSLVLLAACSSTAPQKAAPPSAASSAVTATATPVAAAEPAVALIDWDQTGSSYTLSLVSTAAKVLASAHATWSRGARCGPALAGIIAPPPVSTSNHRAYYLDGDSIKWVQEDGKTGLAFQSLGANATKVYGFAVAADDSVFALNTIDYSKAPSVSQSLTVTKVGAPALGAEIYAATASNTAAVWPVGWRNGDLVLAYRPGTCTQGGGPGIGDARSYHVVNAQTADRKVTIGSDSGGANFVGAAVPAGIAYGSYQGIGDQPQTAVLNWSGQQAATFGAWFLPGGLAPHGGAYVGNTASGDHVSLTLIRAAGNQVTVPAGDCFACSVMWIDDSHFVVTPNQGTPEVFASGPDPLQGVAITGAGYPVARIPGSLDGA